MKIDYSDLEMAFEFVSSGYEYEHAAYIDKETGQIFYESDASEDEIPIDIDTNNKYIMVPNKKEFGLGRPLAIEFARTFLASDFEQVCSIFSSKGAYARFKVILENRGALDKWYSFEQEAMKEAIIQWCSDNEIDL